MSLYYKVRISGSIERYKAQLVVNEYTLTYGLDYLKIFAQIVKDGYNYSFGILNNKL